MLFAGLKVRIETYLPEVSKMAQGRRPNIFLYEPTKLVNNFLFFFFSKITKCSFSFKGLKLVLSVRSHTHRSLANQRAGFGKIRLSLTTNLWCIFSSICQEQFQGSNHKIRKSKSLEHPWDTIVVQIGSLTQ